MLGAWGGGPVWPGRGWARGAVVARGDGLGGVGTRRHGAQRWCWSGWHRRTIKDMRLRLAFDLA